jgi:hypothetical protein
MSLGNVNKGLDVLPSNLVGWTQAEHTSKDCELLFVVTTRSERKTKKNVLSQIDPTLRP